VVDRKAKIGRLAPALMLLSVIVMVVARATASYFDFAVANIITVICGLTFYVTALMLWLRVGRASRRLKTAVVFAPLGLIFVGLCFYEPLGLDSELVPRFRYRWGSDPLVQAEKNKESVREPESALSPSISQGLDKSQGLNDYAGFLGSDRSATIKHASFSDPSSWTESTPQLLWKRKIGAGWSAFSVVGEVAVTLEQRDDYETLQAYALKTGEPLWKNEWKARHTTSLGGLGPRSTPVIANGIVYAQGANGYFIAAKLDSGEKVWDKSLLDCVGVELSQAESEVAWGRSSSPLVVENKVIIPLGGAADKIATLICFDAQTGEEKWRTGREQVSYASPTLMNLQQTPQIVSVNNDTVSSHRLEDGAELWRTDWPGSSSGPANVSQPVAVDDQRVLLSKAYGSGAKMLKVTGSSDGTWKVEELWKNSSVLKTKFTNVVIHEGYAYGLSDGILECVDLGDGQRKWKSKRYRHGQIMLVGQHLLIVAEDGSVAIGVANPESFEELYRFQAIEGMTWNNAALAGNLLLVRNGEQAACYRLPMQSRTESVSVPAAE